MKMIDVPNVCSLYSIVVAGSLHMKWPYRSPWRAICSVVTWLVFNCRKRDEKVTNIHFHCSQFSICRDVLLNFLKGCLLTSPCFFVTLPAGLFLAHPYIKGRTVEQLFGKGAISLPLARHPYFEPRGHFSWLEPDHESEFWSLSLLSSLRCRETKFPSSVYRIA